MKIGLGFDMSDIYIGRYFSNFTLSLKGSGQVGFGLGFYQNPNPNWIRFRFFSKTQTQPYLLSGRVKPDPLGLG